MNRVFAKPLPDILPKPNDFGTYWIGPASDGPAVFRSPAQPKAGCRPGKYFATAGEKQGILMDAGGIRYFDTPEAALSALITATRS